MKLLLASWGPWRNSTLETAFLDLLSKPIQENNVIILTMDTTSDFFVKYLENITNWYKQIGFQEKNINIYNLNTDTIPSFENLDVLLMCGGNTFHYLHRIRDTELNQRLRDFIDRDGVYVGSSAGSNIMCPDVDDNLTTDVNDIGLENVTGFGYVDFIIMPHWGTINGMARTAQIKYSWETGKRVIPLTDQQAILVQDDGFKIISP